MKSKRMRSFLFANFVPTPRTPAATVPRAKVLGVGMLAPRAYSVTPLPGTVTGAELCTLLQARCALLRGQSPFTPGYLRHLSGSGVAGARGRVLAL